ncbi:unnamed protein product [Closterium sp. NIES-53]
MGCSHSPLAPSYASAAAVDVLGAEDVGAASASGKRRNSKGKGGRDGGGGSGGGGGGSSGGGGGGGSGGGSGGFGSGSGGGQRQQQQRQSETPLPQQLSEWFSQRGASGGSGRCPYVIRTEFGDEAERPRWAEQLRSGFAIFDLDYDAILAAMYALSVSAEGDYHLCLPPDPSIEFAVLPGTAPAEALHIFTIDSGASRSLARSSIVLPCPAVPSASLSGLFLPSFSTNLVSTAALQDAMVTTTTPGGQRVSICTCTRTGSHLATFTRRPGSSLYTLAGEPPLVAASAQVSASGPVAPPCWCCLLSHKTLLWHYRLGHPSLPRLRGMHTRLLVSGLPRSLPPLPPSPAPPCLPCVEGWQRVAPHSSSFPPMTIPLQTLHMDMWGPARVSGQGRERYFLLVVDDYMRYTTVFPLRSKGEVPDVLIPWIRALRLRLCERFREDHAVLRLHSGRGGEFSSDLLQDFCRGEGILQTFKLPASPQQNGIAERRISLVMETLPTLRWTGKVGNASVFWVLGSRSFVCDTSADKLSARAIPCVFLGFPPHARDCQFYHPTSRRVFPSQDVTFDESVPFYRPAPSGVSQVDPLPGTLPVEVVVASGAARGAAFGGAASTGVEPWGAEPTGVEPGGAESEGAESGVAEPRGFASFGGLAGASPRLSPQPEPLSPQQLREWFAQRTRLRSGAARAGDSAARETGAGGVGAVDPGGRGAGAGGAVSGGTGAGGTVRPRPFFSPLLRHVLNSFTYRHEPGSRPALPVRAICTSRQVPRPRPPPVPGTHAMALRPSSIPLRVPLPAPPEFSLPTVPQHREAAKRLLRYLCSTSGRGLVLGGLGPVVLTGHEDASWVDDSATQWFSQGYNFSLGSSSVSWRSTRSSSVLSSSCEAEIYAGAIAAQELCWLTYLLTDLGEQHRSPPVLYIDNKAMIALCQEHRLEHRTKHIALRYFLARELQQRSKLHIAYGATRANTADIFTKALPPGDHQRFSTVLGLVLTLPHLLTA